MALAEAKTEPIATRQAYGDALVGCARRATIAAPYSAHRYALPGFPTS